MDVLVVVDMQEGLLAEKVIEHHHWVWRNLISDFPVTIAEESEL